MDLIELFVGLVGTCVGCVPFAAGFLRWRRRRAGAAFEHAVAPILHDLRNVLGKRLRSEQRRLLIRDAVRLASLAAFRRERPDPDESSLPHARERMSCGLCGLEVDTDACGCCQDCGLGARHWCTELAPTTRKRLPLAR